MPSRETTSAVLLAVLIALADGRSEDMKTPVLCNSESPKINFDACEIAVRHYDIEDIPSEEIVRLFEQLAQKGDVRGTMWIARLYDKGRCSLPKRPDIAQKKAKEVIPAIMKLAEKGDPEAQFLLGAAYQEGFVLKQNFEMAREWLTKSADAGQTTAMNNLGMLFVRGHGTGPNIGKARLLFSQAAELGSVLAFRNLSEFSGSGRNDSERLKLLRSALLVQALGMKRDPGIKFLVTNALISDPKRFEEDEYKDRRRCRFREDGIVLNVDVSDRITNVEGHAKGSLGPKQFRGEIPLGLPWNANGNSVVKALGETDDNGYAEPDKAYGFVYHIENVSFVVLISYEGEQHVKLWRAYEIWATKYPPMPSPELGKQGGPN